MGTHEDYAAAAALLWGAAGELAAGEFARINRDLFAGSIPPMPVIIGLTAFGRCTSLTRGGWLDAPRITLAPEVFNGSRRTPGGRRMVADTLVHEMIHAALMFRGEDASHNAAPWCRMITELSPDVLGHAITARPVMPRRVPNPARASDPAAPRTIVVRKAEPGSLTQAELATWPHPLRPAGYYDGDLPIAVPAY